MIYKLTMVEIRDVRARKMWFEIGENWVVETIGKLKKIDRNKKELMKKILEKYRKKTIPSETKMSQKNIS